MANVFLFDMDGTIADTQRETIDALLHIHRSIDCRQVTQDDIAVFRTEGWNAFLVRVDLDPKRINEVADVLRRRWAESIDTIPVCEGMSETLLALKNSGHRLGIVTSNTPENVDMFLRARELQIFDVIAAGNTVLGKDVAIINALHTLEADPAHAWYVGDEQRDIQASRSAGLRVIAVTWGFGDPAMLRALKPDACIDRPDELLRIAEL